MEAKNIYLKNALFLHFHDNESTPEKAGKTLASFIQCAIDIVYPIRHDGSDAFDKSIKNIKRKWLQAFLKSLIEHLMEEEKL